MQPVANSESYAFATFEVDANARELRRNGRLQTVQPKVFDLLVYFIRHRQRVVTKAELLDEVWHGAELNYNVVARAVMRVREAIGDKSEGGRLLRTVHRIGYRFCAVEEAASMSGLRAAEAQTNATPQATDADDTGTTRIAVLPMENRIRSADFGWVPLGLSSLIARALEADPRFSVVPFATMLQTLATLPADASASEQTERLMNSVGAQCVLRSTVHGSPAAFSIEFLGEGPRGAGLGGRLDGSDLTDLGEWLAREVERHVFPKVEATLRFESSNALVNQTFAAALQARNEQRNEASLKLIEVVLGIEPDNADAMLFQLQAMMNALDPRVIEVGAVLLRHPKFLANRQLLAQAHASLGLASMLLADAGAAAQQHAEQALRLVGPGRSDESALRIYGICGVIASSYGDPAQARSFALHCIEKQRLSGDRFSLALNLINLAGVDIDEGDLAAGRARLEEALAFLRPNGFTNTTMNALVNLASGVHAPRGEWTLAIRLCDEARALMPAFARQRNNILWIATMSIVYAEMSMAEPIDAALEALEVRDDANKQALHAAWLTTRAHRSIAASDFEGARAPLAEALEIHRATQAVMYLRRGAALFVRNELRAGHIDAALAAAETLLADEPCVSVNGEMQGLRLHALAAAAHARRDDAGAAALLASAVDCFPRGCYQAHAVLDAAWLALELAKLDQAEKMLARVPAWTLEHPHGRAAASRLRLALENGGTAQWHRAPHLLSMSTGH